MNYNDDTTPRTEETYVGKRSFSYFAGIIEEAKRNNHAHWFQGLPVTPGMYEFLCAIRAKRCHFIAAADSMPVYAGGTEYRLYTSVGIAFADLPSHRVGVVSIVNGQYCVESPKIQNEKYSSSNSEYHTRKSKDMKKMVKIALQHFKPFTMEDVRKEYKQALVMAVYNVADPIRSKIRDTLQMTSEEVMAEISNMIAAGYAPATAAFRQGLALMQAEGAELKRLQNYKPRACFVWAKRGSLVYQFDDAGSEPVEITNLADLPEVINTKLAVLNIAEEGSPIPDVGVRVDRTCFWVFV